MHHASECRLENEEFALITSSRISYDTEGVQSVGRANSVAGGPSSRPMHTQIFTEMELVWTNLRRADELRLSFIHEN